jgi:hypothetical protein
MTSDRGDYGAKPLSLEIQFDGTDLYAVFQGVRIAKRGAKGTPQALTWISLEPGFRVRDEPGKRGKLTIVIEYWGSGTVH